MIKRFLPVLFLFLLCHLIYGQKNVHGLILDEVGEPVPGASIKEVLSNFETTSNINGNFDLLLHSDTACIKISYVAFFDTLLCNLPDSIPAISLKPDLVEKGSAVVCCVDYFWVDNTTVGFYSGILHNPYGISIGDFTSYLFDIPIMTVASFEYKTDFEYNSDIHVGIARYQGDKFKAFHFGVSYAFDKIQIIEKESQLNYFSHSFNTTWLYKKTLWTLGYGYSRKDNKFYHGIISSFGFVIPNISINVETYLELWFAYFNYSFNLYKPIPRTNVTVGIGYETIEKQKELNIKLAYKIRH